jgi:DNA-binding LacI/PurR family transcriptional regulator
LLEDNLSKVCIATDKKHTAPAKGIIQAFKEKGLPFENSNILCKETKHETGFYKKLETFIMEKKNMDALWIMEPVEYEALTVIDNHFEELSHLKLIIRNGTYFRNHNDKIKPYLTINFPYFEQGIKAASAFIDKIKNGYDDHIKINIKMDI